MNYRLTSLMSTISNSFCDFTLDIAVNKFNKYRILFYSTIIAFLLQIVFLFFVGISVTWISIPIIALYGIVTLFGYMSFVKALQYTPLVLVALIEVGTLFFYLFVDTALGYIELTPFFILTFIIFVSSVIWFIIETNKTKEQIKLKTVKTIGIAFCLLIVLFYGLGPYIIRWASTNGANETAINIGYYFIAIPFFLIMLKKTDEKDDPSSSKASNKIRMTIIKFVLLIGILEAFYYFFQTLSFMHESPVIVSLIAELRVFILVLLAVIFKTDKMTLKKWIALIIGVLSVAVIYFN